MSRKPTHPINDIILNRWSSRAMSGESLSDDELMPLFEAARWAPSSFNNQPWRFIYAKRDDDSWSSLFDLLIEGNQAWAKNAAALVIVISRKTFEHNDKPARTHTYDTGAAAENLAIEGTQRGLVVHAMEGFDYDKAKAVAKIPDNFQVEAMIAIGKKGKTEDLPEHFQKGEEPNGRKELGEIVMEGQFRE